MLTPAQKRTHTQRHQPCPLVSAPHCLFPLCVRSCASAAQGSRSHFRHCTGTDPHLSRRFDGHVIQTAIDLRDAQHTANTSTAEEHEGQSTEKRTHIALDNRKRITRLDVELTVHSPVATNRQATPPSRLHKLKQKNRQGNTKVTPTIRVNNRKQTATDREKTARQTEERKRKCADRCGKRPCEQNRLRWNRHRRKGKHNNRCSAMRKCQKCDQTEFTTPVPLHCTATILRDAEDCVLCALCVD
jgi:hypothetical protein